DSRRGELRAELRKQSEHFAKMPLHELDKHINEVFHKWIEIQVTADDIFEFLRNHDEMNPKHLNFSRFKDLETTDLDVDVVYDRFERRINAINHNGKDGDTDADNAVN